MSAVITPEDDLWKTSYAVIRQPRHGESLASYLLLLDDENRLPGGATLREIRRVASGPSTVAGPGNFLSGRLFDLHELSLITGGVPVERLEALTLRPLLGSGLVGLDPLRGHPGRFRICPACLAGRGIPLVFLLAGVEACPIHGVALVPACVCGEPILPFGQQNAGSCHGWGCRMRYADMPADAVSAAAVDWSRMAIAFYEMLIASAPSAGYVARLGIALRSLIARRVAAPDRRRALRQALAGGVGLGPAVTVMLAADTTPAEVAALVAGLAEIHGRPRADTARNYSSDRCPNESCPSVLGEARPSLKAFPSEINCLVCGTRYRADRILFSFDRIDGYPTWRSERNQSQLEARGAQVRAVCADRLERDETVTVSGVLRDAGIPNYQYTYQSQRAGLVEIISAARAEQLERRSVAPVPRNPDPRVERFLRVHHRAHLVGVRSACREAGMASSRYYGMLRRLPATA